MGRYLCEVPKAVQFGAATYQKRIYVYSPKGEFWKIQQPSVFNEWRENLARLARQTGWVAINGEPLLSTLDEFRHRDNWHFATNRGSDWGLASQFQKILTLIMAIGRFVCVDDPMMRALASCPLRDLPLPNQTAQLYLSGVARFATPIQPASVSERFEATPFALALLLEEAVCFISPAQCKILNGAVAKQGRYAGKCWVALDVRQLVGSMPRWRFQRYAWHARSASFGTGFVHSTPKTLTPEMMEEVMFNIGPLAKNIHITIGYISPRMLPFYNTAVTDLVLRNPNVPPVGYALNFLLNDEVDPLEVPEALTYVLDISEQHSIYQDFRTDLSFFQALATAHDTALEAASADMQKSEPGTTAQLQDEFKSNIHISFPSEKKVGTTTSVEAFAVVKPRVIEGETPMEDVGGIQVEKYVHLHWKIVESRRGLMRKRLQEITRLRETAMPPQLPRNALSAGESSAGVGTGAEAPESAGVSTGLAQARRLSATSSVAPSRKPLKSPLLRKTPRNTSGSRGARPRRARGQPRSVRNGPRWCAAVAKQMKGCLEESFRHEHGLEDASDNEVRAKMAEMRESEEYQTQDGGKGQGRHGVPP